jgi:hypothetical protein
LDKLVNEQNTNLFSRQGLKSTVKLPTLAELVAEGDAIIEAEERAKRAANTMVKKGESQTAPTAPAPMVKEIKPIVSTNPYVIARENILKKMDNFCRKEILEMERTGDKDNRIYNEFIVEVRKEGDRLQQ